jgi:REP element-mobilizing transposase RayT
MSTFSQIYIHIVFAVKHREALIHQSWEAELFKYITGIVQKKGHKMIVINGMPDHIHIFLNMKPIGNLSDLVREIKKSSSAFIKENKLTNSPFYWQGGFGAFSYGQSQISAVANYVQNQKQIHEQRFFKNEFIDMLNKYKVDFNEKYLFDFITET